MKAPNQDILPLKLEFRENYDMKSFIVRSSIQVTLFQIFVMLVFAASLYFFIQQKRIEQTLETQTAAMTTESAQIQAAEQKLKEYQAALDSSPKLKQTPGKIEWEQVSFGWKNLSLNELLQRLQGISANDRFFIVHSFAYASMANLDENLQKLLNQQNIKGDSTVDDLKFTLEGYYLCPCQ